MQEVTELPFDIEYRQALTQHIDQSDDCSLQAAHGIGCLAKSFGMSCHEVVLTHAEALRAYSPLCGSNQLALATAFLAEVLRSLETESATQQQHSLKRAAHELRTPLTTLRLALQVSLGRLEKGDTIEPAVLQKALMQVNKLAATIAELVSSRDKLSRSTSSPES